MQSSATLHVGLRKTEKVLNRAEGLCVIPRPLRGVFVRKRKRSWAVGGRNGGILGSTDVTCSHVRVGWSEMQGR